jgi:putative transposase
MVWDERPLLEEGPGEQKVPDTDKREIRGKGRFSREQVIEILKEFERGTTVVALSRRYGISTTTFYKWRAKFSNAAHGGSDRAGQSSVEKTRLAELEEENRRLKALLGTVVLENAGLRELLSKPGE